MAKYVFVYSGGSAPESPEAQEATMKAWTDWFGQLGAAVVDGGDPFLVSATVRSDGSVTDGGSLGATGWSAVNAESLADAADRAKGCPLLADGGTVDVYEAAVM